MVLNKTGKTIKNVLNKKEREEAAPANRPGQVGSPTIRST
jgi:hypothetical protein